MNLSQSERDNLFEALLDGYRNYDKLKIMVRLKLGEDIARLSKEADTEIVILNLIEWAESENRVLDLVWGANEKNSGNPQIKDITYQLFGITKKQWKELCQLLSKISPGFLEIACQQSFKSEITEVEPRLIELKKFNNFDNIQPILKDNLIKKREQSSRDIPIILEFVDSLSRIKDISSAIRNDLKEWVSEVANQLNIKLETTVVSNLIDSAEARINLERLIVEPYEHNPDNRELKNFYETAFENFKQRAILDYDVTPKDFGPNIDWRGKTDEIELQRFFKKQPDWYDVGFLQRIIEQAKSVCRVDVPSLDITGTGVLIASKYVLTNYHVLKLNDKDNPELNAKNVHLNFGCFSLNDGRETKSKPFFLDSENPIIAFSPVEELDYILLQLEETFTQALNSDDATIKPAQWETNIRVSEADSINILQHPNGESMKLSIISNPVNCT